jgi:hypothetical protein
VRGARACLRGGGRQLLAADGAEDRQRAFQRAKDKLREDRVQQLQRMQQDRIVLKGQGLHHLPSGLWEEPGALEHVQLIDVSKNCLTTLPARLLFWVGGLKKLDASQNNLRELPVRGGVWAWGCGGVWAVSCQSLPSLARMQECVRMCARAYTCAAVCTAVGAGYAGGPPCP